jgi:hypothetical protein
MGLDGSFVMKNRHTAEIVEPRYHLLNGQRFSAGKWEGGVLEVLHIRLACAALAYLACAAKYALA